MENKRGAAIAVNTIIFLILGVAVLVILIIGFTLGWSTIVPFIQKDNVDTVVKSCETSCSTQSKFSYCSKEMDLNTGALKIKTTCHILQKVHPEFGIEPCPINCDMECASLKVGGKEGELVTGVSVAGGLACPDSRKDVSAASKTAPPSGQLCCIKR